MRIQYNKVKVQLMSEIKLPPIGRSDEGLQPDQNAKGQEDGKKIWEKKTASCGNNLQRFDKYPTAVDPKYVPINSFSNKDKHKIETALEIVTAKKKNKDLAAKKETVFAILEQKKEMFLVTMTHGIIEKQIKNLSSQSEERELALKESSDILQTDQKDFQEYYEKFKNKTKKIEDQFEKEVQKRLAKEQEIKAKQITVNSLRAEKARNEESISSYLKYKKFLDQLPPKEWIDEREREKKERIKAIKERLRNSAEMKGMRGRELEAAFAKMEEEGENEEMEEIQNNEEVYFKEPGELIEFFNNLEETNLFNIQNAHYAEQKYQEEKAQWERHLQALETAFQGHCDQKRILEKQLADIEAQVRQLRKKKEQTTEEKDTKDITALVELEYRNIRDSMLGYMPTELDYNNAEPLSVLSAIEICMERLWDKLKEIYADNPKLTKELKIQLEKRKNNEKREETTNSNKLEEEKRKNRNTEKKEPIFRTVGRADMKRSPPQEKAMVKKEETTGKDMDDDKKYLIE